MNMFGLEGSGFIIAISITLLAAGLVIYYCNNRFAAIEKVVQRQGQVVGTWLAEVKASLAGGAQLQGGKGPVPSGPVSQDATPEAVAAAERYNSGEPQPKVEVSDDSEEESDEDDDDESSDSGSESDNESEAPFVADAGDVGGVKVVDVDLQELSDVVDGAVEVIDEPQIKSVIVGGEIEIESLNDEDEDDEDEEDDDDDDDDDESDESEDQGSSPEVSVLEPVSITLNKDDDSSSVNLGDVDDLSAVEVVEPCCNSAPEEKEPSVGSSATHGTNYKQFKKQALVEMVQERGICDEEAAKKMKVAELRSALKQKDTETTAAAH